jgi:hypothetical protein
MLEPCAECNAGKLLVLWASPINVVGEDRSLITLRYVRTWAGGFIWLSGAEPQCILCW